MSFSPLTWNADQEQLSGGRRRTRFSGKHRNFRKLGSSVWAPISTDIALDRTVTAFGASVEFPATANGWMNIEFDNGWSMKRHVAERNGDNSEPALTVRLSVVDASPVEGIIDPLNPNQMLYQKAWPTADLRLGVHQGRSTVLQHIVEIHTAPSRETPFAEYSFLLQSSTAKIWTGPGHRNRPWDGSPGRTSELSGTDAFIAYGDSTHRGAKLKTPEAWYFTADGQKVRQTIRVYFEVISPSIVKATKYIPRQFIADGIAVGSRVYTDATFSPDADPESSTVDGRTTHANSFSSWSSLVASAGLFFDDSAGLQVVTMIKSDGATTWDTLSRLLYGFDTSSLNDSHTVTGATIGMKFGSGSYNNPSNIDFNIYADGRASNTTLAASDFATVESTQLAAAVSSASMTGDDYVTWTLNAAGRTAINLSGITNLALAAEADRADSEPTNPGSGVAWTFRCYFAERSGTSEDPVLDVTTAPAANPAALLML